MQVYRLLGTLNTFLRRQVLVSELLALGWALKDRNEESDIVTKHKVKLQLEGEGTLLLDASFSGEPEDITPFLDYLDTHSIHYALDLFGDSARLVRRFIK